jgi:hypothetical protein
MLKRAVAAAKKTASAAKKAASAVQGASQKAEAAVKKAAAETAADATAAQQKTKDEEAAVKKVASRRAYWQRRKQRKKETRSRASEESAAEARPCWIADDAGNRKKADETKAKHRRRGRGIDVRLSDAWLADLNEVCKLLSKLLQSLVALRDKRGRGRRRRRDRSPAAASSAGPRKDSGKDSEGPSSGAESKPLHCQPPGHVALYSGLFCPALYTPCCSTLPHCIPRTTRTDLPLRTHHTILPADIWFDLLTVHPCTIVRAIPHFPTQCTGMCRCLSSAPGTRLLERGAKGCWSTIAIRSCPSGWRISLLPSLSPHPHTRYLKWQPLG